MGIKNQGHLAANVLSQDSFLARLRAGLFVSLGLGGHGFFRLSCISLDHDIMIGNRGPKEFECFT